MQLKFTLKHLKAHAEDSNINDEETYDACYPIFEKGQEKWYILTESLIEDSEDE